MATALRPFALEPARRISPVPSGTSCMTVARPASPFLLLSERKVVFKLTDMIVPAALDFPHQQCPGVVPVRSHHSCRTDRSLFYSAGNCFWLAGIERRFVDPCIHIGRELAADPFEQLATLHFEGIYKYARWLTLERQEAEDVAHRFCLPIPHRENGGQKLEKPKIVKIRGLGCGNCGADRHLRVRQTPVARTTVSVYLPSSRWAGFGDRVM
jgi:hypothetical protein